MADASVTEMPTTTESVAEAGRTGGSEVGAVVEEEAVGEEEEEKDDTCEA